MHGDDDRSLIRHRPARARGDSITRFGTRGWGRDLTTRCSAAGPRVYSDRGTPRDLQSDDACSTPNRLHRIGLRKFLLHC